MKLPINIEGLVKAQNEQDSDAFAQFFTDTATVADEGHSYSGRDEIRQWIRDAFNKYHMQLNPIDFQQQQSNAILTVEVSGTFPGSPAIMHYHLQLEADRIVALRITG